MFKEIKGQKNAKKGLKKQLKCVALGGITGHQMAAALLPVHRGGCTYLLWGFYFWFWFRFGPPTPNPDPRPPDPPKPPRPTPTATLVCSNES